LKNRDRRYQTRGTMWRKKKEKGGRGRIVSADYAD
jgi:hypothetical protein